MVGVDLLQVFEESFAQVLADVLWYQTVSKAQKVLYVEENTQGEKAVSLRRIINMQYCCHLLASNGAANVKSNNGGIQAC